MAVLLNTNQLSTVNVSFNSAMNRYSVENAIRIKKIDRENFNEVKKDGYFDWNADGKTVKFIPYSSWSYGKYRIEIDSKCEDENGNDIPFATNITFQIGRDLDPPGLLFDYPENRALDIPANTNITLVFSEPIDIGNINEVFTISPSFGFYIQIMSNQTTFNLIPYTDMKNGFYNLEIKQLKDVYGNTIYAPITLSFTVGSDFIAPNLLGFYTNTNISALSTNLVHRLDKMQDMYFVFSEALDVDVFNVPISFSPAINGIWEINSNVLHFTPSEAMDIGQYYNVTVNGLKDFSGNTMSKSSVYEFQISSSNSFFLSVKEIKADTNTLTNNTINVLKISNSGALTNAQNIKLDFRFNSSLKMISVPEHVSVSYVSGSGSLVSPFFTAISYSNVQRLNDTFSIVVRDLSFYNIYKVTLQSGKSGVLDTNDNWMKEDDNIYFKLEP